ncbi:uracil-DNA glycosylase, family 4 [Limimonas halophila]|uniref:Type-5 uracil-DNA glycosylase n=1 Tax=Limimonas halophila TaxID=1082479 RepID=A0A1G7P253_9PROT|nr:uracil-DNA glycosylase [Limimonas halophila]SDF80375.1 uracil-DNA glycosylase, family 4 [Limimonas halophila]
MAATEPPEPAAACAKCSRLAAFRETNRAAHPSFWNAPVPAFGGTDARLLVVGLAPGLKGANRTGRPFTGDYAGEVLYQALLDTGFARGTYAARADDGLRLNGCRVTNAVRCVPPDNKPTAAEIRTCSNAFLAGEIAALPRLRAILALGKVAHDAVLGTQGLVKAHHPFAHGREHSLPNGLTLADCYHCSRYNVNTGRMTPAMLRDVLTRLSGLLDAA